MSIPPYPQLRIYVLKALRILGGSAKVSDVENLVAEMLQLSDTERTELHKLGKTRLAYRVAWARFALKKEGMLERSKRGVSVLSEKGRLAKLPDISQFHIICPCHSSS